MEKAAALIAHLLAPNALESYLSSRRRLTINSLRDPGIRDDKWMSWAVTISIEFGLRERNSSIQGYSNELGTGASTASWRLLPSSRAISSRERACRLGGFF